jgi:hypothetical protein
MRLTRPRSSGFALLEALVYIGLVIMLLGAGYLALYRCIDNSFALRRSAEDIARALRLGEVWRADVRAASGDVRVENGAGEQTLLLPGGRRSVTYRFAAGALFRKVGEAPWVRLLDHIKASTMEADHRRTVVAWRWELELQPQSKASVKAPRIRPLFTFLAVPEKGPSATASVQPATAELADAGTPRLLQNH